MPDEMWASRGLGEAVSVDVAVARRTRRAERVSLIDCVRSAAFGGQDKLAPTEAAVAVAAIAARNNVIEFGTLAGRST